MKTKSKPPKILTICAILLLSAAIFSALFPDQDTGSDNVPTRLPGYNIELPDYIKQDFIPVNPYSRPGRWLERVNNIVIHYVGNPGSSAKGNRNYFASLANQRENNLNHTYASSHFIIGLNGEIIQCIPLTEISYASNHRNSDTISIEVCHPDKSGEFSNITYQSLIKLSSWLCNEFDLNPEADLIRHYDVTGKICPKYYVENPEAWENLKSDVAAYQN